jgi:flavin-dependent dehydrogenase
VEGIEDGYAPRRKILDAILVNAAIEAGVELREHFTLDGLLTDGDKVTGIHGHHAKGNSVSENAHLVIGADGMRSSVAHAVKAPSYNALPALTCAYYTYWSGVSIDGVELYPRPGRMIIAAPTNDGQTLSIVYWPHGEFHKVRSDLEVQFQEALRLAPGLEARIREGVRSERFMGTAALPNYFRKPFGHGWALVGDAGYHKDPITAQGITDSFRQAESLANAVDAGLSGRRELSDALAHYEQVRNESAMPMFNLTCQFATLEPPEAQALELFAALRGNQGDTDRFLGVTAGTVPITEFFAPLNIERIMRAPASAV